MIKTRGKKNLKCQGEGKKKKKKQKIFGSGKKKNDR